MKMKIERVEITPPMWAELYNLIGPFVTAVADWGIKHDQPLPVTLGVVGGIHGIMHNAGDACDCDRCYEVEVAVAEELIGRFVKPTGTAVN